MKHKSFIVLITYESINILIKKKHCRCTPCGHVFHLACVVQWFENKKNCPQCRHSANERTLRKIFLAETDGDTKEDPNTLQNQLDNAQFQLRLKDTEKNKISGRNQELEDLLRQQKDEIKKLEHDKRKYKEQAEGMKTQNRVLQEERFKYEDALKEAQQLKLKLDTMKSVELAVKGCEGDLNQYLAERGSFDRKTKDIAVLVIVLKKKLAEVKKERSIYEGRLRESVGKQELDKRKVRDLETKLAEAQCNNKVLEKDLWRCQEDLRSMKDNLENYDKTVILTSANDTQPLSSPLKSMSPSPSHSPPPASGYKLPSYKIVGSASQKRSHSPEGDERSPLMPVLHHSSKRLAVESAGSR